MTAVKEAFGPGTLKLGKTTTLHDASCQVLELKLESSKSKTDDINPLCGTPESGVITYEYKLTGEALQDFSKNDGLVAYCWKHKGETVDFEFVPSTAAGRKISGKLVVDPMEIGGKAKENLTSKVEFDVVGTPAIDFTVVKDEAK